MKVFVFCVFWPNLTNTNKYNLNEERNHPNKYEVIFVLGYAYTKIL